jgi:F0F1-type ATP synthase assembly protein I
MAIGKTIGRKAAKATVRHSVRGFSAKAQRKPLRSVSLLVTGGLIGVAAGWLAARKTS